MKTLLLSILSVIATYSANSQLSKGQWIVGGTAEISYSHSSGTTNGVKNDIKTTILEASPGAAYFFMERFCAGLRAGVLTSHLDQVANGRGTTLFNSYYSNDSKITGLAGGPFARYYFLAASRKVNVFADASYAYGYNKENAKIYQEFLNPGSSFPSITSVTNESKYKTHSFSVAGGPTVFLNPNVSLELSLGYTFLKYVDSDLTANHFSAGVGFQVHLGKSK